MSPIAVCAALLILGSCGSSDAAVNRHGDKNVTFDFLVLTREWPFSFCSVIKCKNTQLLQQKYNIHGLWPDVKNGSSHDDPVFCNATFKKSELEPLKHELTKYWIDLLNPSDSPAEFWKQEFVKHGSCITMDSKFNTTFLYFQAALQLAMKHNLTAMLSKAGIQPSFTPINTSQIRQAIRNNFGFLAEVRCRKPDENSLAFIYELRLCFTKDLQPRDCNIPTPTLPHRAVGSRYIDMDEQMLPTSIAGRLMLRTAERLLLWIRGWLTPVQTVTGSSSGMLRDSGTYECADGEMALLPPALKD